MKKVTSSVGVILVAVVLAACANSLAGAKISITVLKAAVGVADVGVAEADRLDKVKCLEKGAEGSEAYRKCRAPMEKKLALYQTSKDVFSRSLSAAEAAVAAYEAKEAGKQIDIWGLIKTGGCALLAAAQYIPEKHRKSVQFYIDLAVTGLKCGK